MNNQQNIPGIKVAEEVEAMRGLLYWVQESFKLRSGIMALGVGYFASVVKIGANQGLALSADGVGSKVLLAQLMDKYDTVGIDCIAMNVNDLICVGAEPIAMLNYLAVQKVDDYLMEEIAKGLYAGATLANIILPGGETAKLPEIINGVKIGAGFDLAGSAFGLVALDKIITGQAVQNGDVLIGLGASGIHSNGFTLARRVLFQEQGLKLAEKIGELGCSLGEALLEPTRIYVSAVMEILKSVKGVKALSHITGGGLFNLTRTDKAVGYDLDFWPTISPIFNLIQQAGKLPLTKMFTEYNMGVGFCLTVSPGEADKVLAIAHKQQIPAWKLGVAREDQERRINLKPYGIVSKDKTLHFVEGV
ncbi:MAG: phosphoribosylformylglycinamidine cyclo-ligase [Candidatus Schekmanbacteria bacterium]|nr:phosphoribosylformylglycinamidine cyclo-ligase [Candidatus Schekmanbacteria bacterium]